MSLPELIVNYINTPYLLIAVFVVMVVIGFQYFRKNKFPVDNLLQSNNLEREFGLSLVGLEDEVQMRTDDDERSTFTPSVFSSESSPAILVVEPNEDMRLFITNALRLNYRVIALSDGAKAYQKACEMVPDLIVINTYIGGMEGVTLCESLKSTPATNHIPVIILTARGEVPANPGIHDLRADNFLVKPFDARELLITVRNLIDSRKKLQAAFRDQLSLSLAMADFQPHDADFLKKLFTCLNHNYSRVAFMPEDMAKELGLTKLQLFRKLKALTNRTPGDILRLYRVEQAKQMLAREDDDQISGVAIRSGFPNLATFNKVFREYAGTSPTDFAAQAKASVDSINE